EPAPPPLKPAQQKAIDAAQQRLDRAKEEYEKAKQEARQSLLKAFTSMSSNLGRRGNMLPADRVIAIDRLAQEEQQFRIRQQLPRSEWRGGPVGEYQLAIYKYRAP